MDVMLLGFEYTHLNILGQVSRQQCELLLMDLPLVVGHAQQALTPSLMYNHLSSENLQGCRRMVVSMLPCYSFLPAVTLRLNV